MAKLAEWPSGVEKTDQRIHEEHHNASEGYLKFIAWWIGVSTMVIISGGGFFIHTLFSQVESMKISLSQMNSRGEKMSRRIAFVEVINREIAEKNGINIRTLESVRDLQEGNGSTKTN